MAAPQKPSTVERIEQAAWSLLRDGRGQEITQRAVYQAIGNRGSMTTIQQALANWWAGLGDHLQQLEYLQGFPPEALAPLLEAFAGIRDTAIAQARAEYEAASREALEAVTTAEAEQAAAVEALEMAKDELQVLRRQLDRLVEKRDALDQQLRSETDRRQVLEQQIPAIREDAQARIAQAEAQIGALQADLTKEEERHQVTETRLTALYDQERTVRAQERAQAEATQQALQGKLEALNQTYLQAQQDGANLASQLSREVARVTGQLDQLNSTQQQLQAQLEVCQTERAEIAASLAEAQAERRHEQTRIRELIQARAKLEKSAAAKDTRILQLTRQAAQQRDRKES